MKNLLGIVAASLVCLVAETGAHAQSANFEPIRFDSGFGGTYIASSKRAGAGLIEECKFLVHDQIAVGGRLEAQVMFGGNIDAGGSVAMDLGAVVALLAKGEYYVTTGPVRPVLGFSLGVYDIASQSIGAGGGMASIDQKAGRYFGGGPQLAVDLGRLRLAATYHAMFGAAIEVHQMIGGMTQTTSYSQNYFAFEMSFRFGGARRPVPATPIPPPGPPPGAPAVAPLPPPGPPAPAPVTNPPGA